MQPEVQGFLLKIIEEIDCDIDDSNIPKGNNNNITQKNSKQSLKSISKQPQSEIFSIIKQFKIPVNYTKGIMIEKCNVEESCKLSSEQAEEFLNIQKCC